MTFFKDLAERTIATYIQSFIGLLLAGPVFSLDVGVLKAAAIAAIPAALAVVKAVIAKRFGSSDSASFVGDV